MAGLVPFNRRRSDLASTGYNDFYNMLDDFFSEGWPLRRSLVSDTFKVDVEEDENSYTVTAELPGVKKEEVHVYMDDGKLGISVEREENVEEQNKNFIHRERRFSSMARNIYLVDADSSGISAKLTDGVLKITVQKAQKRDTSVNIEIE